jgi:hypothetical protein
MHVPAGSAVRLVLCTSCRVSLVTYHGDDVAGLQQSLERLWPPGIYRIWMLRTVLRAAERECKYQLDQSSVQREQLGLQDKHLRG